ncbi:hypothetical protein SAY87_002524 [Trapa incisa]|uniref:Cystatin domain-containing protein n=1 Tax=Trapa incisa TaxID=236973 RepID=A0AAN7JX25_9MYRT|nr:hypothetical protein SAY87_002524 [Trapa incisa]
MASSYPRSNSSSGRSIGTATVLLSILLLISTVSGFRGRVGGRMEVKDVKSNEQVQELGRFSVEEYNRMRRHSGHENGQVTFYEVVAAETQVVAGIKYYLEIEGRLHGITRVFDSVVVVKPWLQSKQLLHFCPSKTRYCGV